MVLQLDSSPSSVTIRKSLEEVGVEANSRSCLHASSMGAPEDTLKSSSIGVERAEGGKQCKECENR